MISFNEVIGTSVVCLQMTEATGDEVIGRLIREAVAQGQIVPALETSAIQAVVRRERSASTTLPDGIALPHGRLAGLPAMVCMIGIHPEGVAFGAEDGARTHLFVQLLVPVETGTGHIHFLANLSRKLMECSIRSALLTAADRAAVLKILNVK